MSTTPAVPEEPQPRDNAPLIDTSKMSEGQRAALELTEAARDGADPLIPADWRLAWDWAAAEGYLRRIEGRDRLQALSSERIGLERDSARAFERLVRERTFYALAGYKGR